MNKGHIPKGIDSSREEIPAEFPEDISKVKQIGLIAYGSIALPIFAFIALGAAFIALCVVCFVIYGIGIAFSCL